MRSATRRTFWGVWIVGLIVLTLQARPPEPDAEEPHESRWISWHSADFARNLALFAPFGWLLALGGTRPSRAMLAAAAVAGAIELAQIVLPGRYPSVTDVIANALGSGLGASLPGLGRATGRATRAAPLSLAWALLAGAVFAAPAALLRPSLPDATYYGGWNPPMEQYWPYGGRVEQARLGAEPLRPGRIPDSSAVRLALLREAPLAVEVSAGPAPPRLAALVSIHDSEQREILLLGVQGEDLVFRLHSRADRLRLEPPQWRARAALGDVAPGDRLSLRVTREALTVSIEVGKRRFVALGSTGGDGWRLLLPRDHVPLGLDPVLTCLWVAGLALPLGFWARLHPASGAGLAVLVLALAAAPGLGLQPTPVTQGMAAAVGLGCGVGLRRARLGPLGSGRSPR